MSPPPPPYHGIFMLKSNVDTSIELDTIMCANWLIDWLLKVQQAIFQSYSGWEKFVSKKSERGDSGMGQHGQWLNTGTCFSVSSDDKLVLFLFTGIPTGDPAIVAFCDKRIYKKLRLKELPPKWPLISRKETASEYDKINNCAMIRPPPLCDNWKSVAQRENSN